MSKTFVIFVRTDADVETGTPPKKEALVSMGAYNKTLRDAGILVTAEGLKPSSTGARLTFPSSGNPDDVKVVPGPFPAETLVCGYWIIKLDTFDEAVGWARKIPLKDVESGVEVREVINLDDFKDILGSESKE